jgi:hypothetical protein
MMNHDSLHSTTLMNWGLCCFCQETRKGDELRHPHKTEAGHNAYQSIEKDLNSFIVNQLELPLGLNPCRINNGTGIANTLLQNKAI